MSSPSLSLPFSLMFLFFTLSIVSQAIVPPSKTFKSINQGEFNEYGAEYSSNFRFLNVFAFPFSLCFYNSTPNAYTLAIKMGTTRTESTMRWVWEANRGNPVRENATLTFGTDGNLVLADSDGRIAWQTNTANKGVVDLKLLQNGNLVLHDNQGRFVWQSFDYPTNSLLVGQALRRGGPTKFVSRVSDVDGSEGPYSFVLEKKRMALYFKSKNSPKPILYYIPDEFGFQQVSAVVFNSEPVTGEASYELKYDSYVGNSSVGSRFVGVPKYNSTLSFLRLESDGNLKIYTYNVNVTERSWDISLNLFNRDGVYSVSECKLPMRCGSLGVCEDNQCVACPRPQGLLGWSNTCAPPTLPPCKSGAKNIDYYKVVGVEHFTYDYTEGEGPIKLAECRDKCNKDCGCLGFFYREESSKCLVAPELGTLSKVSNQSHVAYIKMSK